MILSTLLNADEETDFSDEWDGPMFEDDEVFHPLNNQELITFANNHEQLFHHWQLSMERYSIKSLSLLILKVSHKLFSLELLQEYLSRYANDILDINQIETDNYEHEFQLTNNTLLTALCSCEFSHEDSDEFLLMNKIKYLLNVCDADVNIRVSVGSWLFHGLLCSMLVI